MSNPPFSSSSPKTAAGKSISPPRSSAKVTGVSPRRVIAQAFAVAGYQQAYLYRTAARDTGPEHRAVQSYGGSRRAASSARWRSLRPPNVLLGETRQLCRILVAFTLPTLGRASTMSKTFAVSRYGGWSSSSAPIDTRRVLTSRLSRARSARTSLALLSASMR
jgi:hypothetical protein